MGSTSLLNVTGPPGPAANPWEATPSNKSTAETLTNISPPSFGNCPSFPNGATILFPPFDPSRGIKSLMKKQPVMAITLTLFWALSTFAQPTQGTWSKAAPLPGPRSEHQAVSLGGKIYAIGGYTMAVRDG